MEKVKNLVLRNKEVGLFLVGFGIMHIGWYNLQRNKTLNNALAAGRENETMKVSLYTCYIWIIFKIKQKQFQKYVYLYFSFKEYKRLEREINENWPNQQQISNEPQTTGVILTAANALANK